MRLRVVPQDKVFFDLLAALARLLADEQLVLAEMSGAAVDERDTILERVAGICTEADESMHGVLRALRENYITPLPREDIFELGEGLRHACRVMRSVAFALSADALEEPPAGTAQYLQLIGSQAELTVRMTTRLAAMRDLWEYHDEVSRLTLRGHGLYENIVAAARPGLGEAAGPIEVATLALAEALGRADDAFRGIARVVGRIAVKES
ncbi:hypothetical protein [Spelaeicoccus albus]|uniref:Uncharacterized protein Yka (UPF0111/DUF47 family) n=1 Tax=Spelaeicoccus albus TaxID=1280376 RepID=A0A7Z0A9I6_9MICO|nr:hypothetical protein [Spelaeicoccus albus]NYI66045.1 uncharacterized protein Yka (UPF0111/DUF47 family) [Spelaeicoccus albus]